MVKHLDDLGLLSPRLTLAHCVWARRDELELLAERGVTIAVNTSSNLHLRSGIAPVATMLEAGCRIALGIDGSALEDDDDALRELRLGHLLHVGNGFQVEVNRGRHAAGGLRQRPLLGDQRQEGGAIRAGDPADILLLDWASIDDDRLRDDIDTLQLMLTRATARHIRELIVAGRIVVKDGSVTGVDAEGARIEVISRMRHAMRDKAPLAAVLPRWKGPSPGTSSRIPLVSERLLHVRRRHFRLAQQARRRADESAAAVLHSEQRPRSSRDRACTILQSSTTRSAGLPIAMP